MPSRILNILNKSAIAGLVGSFLSFIFPLIPCMKSPVVAEPKFSPGLCTLPNPFKIDLAGINQRFYGVFSEPLAGLVLQFIVIFAIFLIIFLLIRKRAGKVLDLTAK